MKKTTRKKKAVKLKTHPSTGLRMSTEQSRGAQRPKLKGDAVPEKRDYIPVLNSSGKEVEQYRLDNKIFDGRVNKGALYDAVRMYQANARQGTASTKTRGDVSGGGKKPWRQKGTGRARAGSTRSPLWRHGGVVFGPHPRDFHYDIPKKVKRLAFLSSINMKLNENKIIGLEAIKINEPKTRCFMALMGALKLKGKSLFVLDAIDENIKRSSRNIETVSLRGWMNFSTMDVMASDNLVITKASLEKLAERVS